MKYRGGGGGMGGGVARPTGLRLLIDVHKEVSQRSSGYIEIMRVPVSRSSGVGTSRPDCLWERFIQSHNYGSV